MSECSLLGWVTLTVLFLTGAVITWYTVETYRLRRESQLQTRVADETISLCCRCQPRT